MPDDTPRFVVPTNENFHRSVKAKAAADGWPSITRLIIKLLEAWLRGEIQIKPPLRKGEASDTERKKVRQKK